MIRSPQNAFNTKCKQDESVKASSVSLFCSYQPEAHLDQTVVDLDQTKANLEQTEVDLGQTKVDLDHTKEDLDPAGQWI